MRFLPLLLLASAAAAQTIEFTSLTETSLENRLRLANAKTPQRYATLKTLFETDECGRSHLREQAVKGSKEPNIICEVPGNGESPRKIIVGAHFDSAGGDGVVDNWSGAVLLPSLARFMRDSPRRHTFEFIGFAGEERGLLGSKAYVKSVRKEQSGDIAAGIFMDSLGLSPTKYWPNGSDKDLVLAAALVAQALKVDFVGVGTDRIGTTDSAVFKNAKIPVLSLHSLTQETWRLINGTTDVWKIVSMKDYYDSHRLVCALLVYLDRKLP